MNLPGFLTADDFAARSVRPAARTPPWCRENYDSCMENCANWGDPNCPCYCQNDLCSCMNPNCPRQRCE